MSEINDLVLRAQRGDPEAMNEVLAASEALIVKVAMDFYQSYVFDDSVGLDDLKQTGRILIFTRAVRNFKAKGSASFSTYLYRSLNNSFLDLFKFFKRRKNHTAALINEKGVEIDKGCVAILTRNFVQSPDVILMEAEDRRFQKRQLSHLVERIKQLPEGKSEIVCMRFGLAGHEAHTPQEIAAKQGVDSNTVRWHLHDAMRTLKSRTSTKSFK